MISNTSKFTGVQPVAHNATTSDKPVTNANGFYRGLLVSLIALIAMVFPAAAAYTPSQTPIALGCVTAQAPDIIAMNGDIFLWALNLVGTHPILLIMLFLSIMLIVFGAIVSLFRRGRRRGR